MSSVLWGSADFVGGLMSRRLRPVVVVGVSQGLAFVALAVWVLWIGAWHDPHGYLPWAAAAGVVGPVALAAFYAALASGTMGVVAPIAASGVMVPVLIGLAGGDRPSVAQYAGIALAVAGVVLASGPELRGTGSAEGPTSAQARAVVLAMLAAVGFGLVLWFLARGGDASVPMTLVTMRFVSALTMGLVVLGIAVRASSRPPGGARFDPAPGSLALRDLPILAGVGIADAAANGTFAQASTGGLLAVVSVLGSLYPVATAVLARVFLAERLLRVQLVGVSVALTGIVLIGLGGGTG
jgi:drug/metabolite transporter (DMT)-like permease